jgi:hypothetical protein
MFGSHKDEKVMNIASASGSASTRNQFPYRVLIASTGAVLLFIGLRITPDPLAELDAAAVARESHFAYCDHLGGVAIEELGANGIEIRSDAARGERQSAVQTCLNIVAK